MNGRRMIEIAAAIAALAIACAPPYVGLRKPQTPVEVIDADRVSGWETFETRDGTELFAQWWRPSGEPKAVVIVMHGLKDHGSRYDVLAAKLVDAGFAVHAFDLRGHGRSSGRRVAIGSFDDYVDDLVSFIERVRVRDGYAGKPVFLFGHSMGGAIVTLTTITRRPEVAGVILSAPALRLDLWPITVALTRLTGTVAPNAGAIKPPNRQFSTDPEIVKGMDEDPLIYQDPGPAHTASELGRAIALIWDGVDRMTVPLLVLHGTGDTLTSPRGSRDLRDRAASTDKTLVLYDGLAHDLVHEPGGRPIADVVAWVSAHAGGPRFAAPATPDLGETHYPSAGVRLSAHYKNAGDDGAGGASVNAFTFDVRSRLFVPLVHPSVPYCLGLDGSIGSGADGLAAAVDLYVAGVGVPFGDGSLVAVCGGAGFSQIGDAVPFAWRFPIDASLDLQIGPVRLLGAAQIAWSVGDDERNEVGSETLDAVDELAFSLGVRWGASHRYWSSTDAGAGPYLGVTVHEINGARFIGVVLGLDVWGGN